MATPDAPAPAPRTSNINVRRGEPLVVVDHVDKHFGDLHVLKDINTAVNRGEVVVVIGPSGSGKSTLCRAINRLETIDKGTITLDGEPLPAEGKELARLRAEVGMVFQRFNLFPHMTALENIIEAPVQVKDVPRREATTRARELLERVGLGDRCDSYPAQLSGGQQQRVAIARALAMQPAVLLCDEITSALDPELVGEVLRVVESLAEEGMTLLMVTHEMSFARKVSDRVVFMHAGRIHEIGPPDAVFGAPQTPELKQFLSALDS